MNLLPESKPIDERKLWLLLVALLALFLFYPLASDLGVLRSYRLALAVVLALAAYSVSGERRILRVALALGIPAVVMQVAFTTLDRDSVLTAVTLVLALAFIGFIITVIFASVFRPGRVTGDRIAGAICVYLLLGLLWSMLYGLIDAFDANAFRLPESADATPPEGRELALIYFSFVTMTTLGYGDVAPVSNWAQTFAWLQAVVGQLFIAVLLARLVSLHVAHSGPGDRAE